MLLRRGPAVPAALIAVLLLGGCTGGDPEPTPGPDASVPSEPTPTPSATPTPEPVAAPEPPAELERTDEVGAAAAAKYFLELYSYTMQTGDVAEWDDMSWETCQFCSRTRALANAIHTSNENFTGAVIQPLSTFVHPFDDLVGAYPVDVEFSQSPSEHRNAEGELINASERDGGTFGVDMKWIGGSWKVLAVTSQEVP